MRNRQIGIMDDEHGRELAFVPLNKSKNLECVMLLEDYEYLTNILGLSGNWNTVGDTGYVSCNSFQNNGGKLLIARVLLDCGAGEIVGYYDRNPLNLRRENLLVLPSRKAQRRDRDFIGPAGDTFICAAK